MATVTGQCKKVNRKLDILKKQKFVLEKEHSEICIKFLAITDEEDKLSRDIMWEKVLCVNSDWKKVMSAYWEMGSNYMEEDELLAELAMKRKTQEEFLRCELLYKKWTQKDSRAEEVKAGKQKEKLYKLPTLDVLKFDGKPKDWLPFWNQFKKIHEDSSIEEEDKLQYLQQCTAGEVKDLVGSYPLIEGNYNLVLQSLKDRFASKNVLINHYVGEILKLVSNKRNIDVETLYTTLEVNLRALDSLGVDRGYTLTVFPMVQAALPENLLLRWQRQQFRTDEELNRCDDLDSLMKFLKFEVVSKRKVREVKDTFCGSKFSEKATNVRQKGPNLPTAVAFMRVSEKSRSCIFCRKSDHFSTDCSMAKELSLEERRKIVQRERACFCCLHYGHGSKICRYKRKCALCDSFHATLLCGKLKKEGSEQEPARSPSSETCCSLSKGSSASYLPVLRVRVCNDGAYKTVRMLFDTGCQRSYLKNMVAKELNIEAKSYETLSNQLFGGISTAPKNHALYNIKVCDLQGKFECELEVLGEEEICNSVPCLRQCDIEKFPQIKFSDLNDNESVSLVLGADVFGRLFTGNTKSAEGGLVALETRLGWALTGPSGHKGKTNSTFCLNNISLPLLWDLDVLGIKDPIEVETAKQLEEEVWKQFRDNLKRNKEGRYSVALLWKSNHPVLHNNREIAEGRLRSVTKNLNKNGYYKLYEEVFDEWEKMGIIEEVPMVEIQDFGHYLPHRPVVKLDREKTKIRPVFDASCFQGGNVSLNDCLNKGPNLLELIPPLIIKFRLGRYGIVGDIEKAFLQIELKERDRDFLRFLWWNRGNSENKIKVYRHCRVVFGVCCSPFLLSATIANHLDQYEKIKEIDPDFIKKLRSSFYVDDCITSVNDLNEVNKFITGAQKILKDACFNLRGWRSNGSLENMSSNEASVLGLKWEVLRDVLSCNVPIVDNTVLKKPTKRVILSLANRIFDPIGFLTPVTLLPKLLLQEIWKLGVGWDEPLAEESARKFRRWYNQMDSLANCNIPRWLFKEEVNLENCTLHVFCDASKSAYAATVFLRSRDEAHTYLQLVLAKNRVAPLKEITIPRMELMSACIAVRLVETVQKALPVRLETTFWTDSKVVLAWIQRNEPWSVFVSNRIREIKEKSKPEMWRHVPGELNPADLPSRGCSATFLLQSEWWKGPEWLLEEPEKWPQEVVEDPEDIINSERKKGVCMVSVQKEGILESLINYFSDYRKIVRMVAWMLRWKTLAKNRQKIRDIELTALEINQAEKKLFKVLQTEEFGNKVMESLQSFKLYTDEDGLLRVRSRLKVQELEEEFRNPIVLTEHELVKRMIMDKHRQMRHAGVLTTLSQLREQYFILRGRKLVRKVISKCLTCKKMQVKGMNVPEAPLPNDRINRVAAFQVTGIDLAGPLYLRDGNKVWVAVFTCAVYRAVHLELLNSMSTETFIMAFRRFIARRGRVSVVYTDNGTNFVGAANLLKKLDQRKLYREASNRRITWNFIPPSAPWWGGWWERMVGLVKGLLRKNLGRASVNFIELQTILCDVESVINSRPITYVTEDPNEPEPLTPSHFLLDRKDTWSSTEDWDLVDQKFLGRRMRYLQMMRESLRERFKKEYLSELIYRRNRRNEEVKPPALGELVLTEDNAKSKMFWPLGRIIELIPGKDGHYRLARLQLQGGQILRPLNRLYNLEIETKSSDLSDAEKPFKTRSGRVVKPVNRFMF